MNARRALDTDLAGPQGEQLIDRQVIDYFQPQWYWIENPWLSRMRDYITDLLYVCVDYCQYSDWGYRKRTRLWTNIPLTPRTCDGCSSASRAMQALLRLRFVLSRAAVGICPT